MYTQVFMNKEGKWELHKYDRFKDDDNKYFPFAPPNYNPKHYIDNEISNEYARGGYDDTLPQWCKKMSRMQEQNIPPTPTLQHPYLPICW